MRVQWLQAVVIAWGLVGCRGRLRSVLCFSEKQLHVLKALPPSLPLFTARPCVCGGLNQGLLVPKCLVLVSPCVAGQVVQALVLHPVTAAVELWGLLVVIQPHPLALGVPCCQTRCAGADPGGYLRAISKFELLLLLLQASSLHCFALKATFPWYLSWQQLHPI